MGNENKSTNEPAVHHGVQGWQGNGEARFSLRKFAVENIFWIFLAMYFVSLLLFLGSCFLIVLCYKNLMIISGILTLSTALGAFSIKFSGLEEIDSRLAALVAMFSSTIINAAFIGLIIFLQTVKCITSNRQTTTYIYL